MSDAFNRRHKPDISRLPKLNGWKHHVVGTLYQDGDQILAAVPIRCEHAKDGWYYRFEVLTISFDEEYLAVEDSNGDPWGYNFGDWDFYRQLT
tara:strand:- start:1026 stop:1304 length:279 start_codon:yes stop_codon:yes gene_type:complete